MTDVTGRTIKTINYFGDNLKLFPHESLCKIWTFTEVLVATAAFKLYNEDGSSSSVPETFTDIPS